MNTAVRKAGKTPGDVKFLNVAIGLDCCKNVRQGGISGVMFGPIQQIIYIYIYLTQILE